MLLLVSVFVRATIQQPSVSLCSPGQVRAAGVIGLASMAAAGITASYVTTAIPDKELRYVLAGTQL